MERYKPAPLPEAAATCRSETRYLSNGNTPSEAIESRTQDLTQTVRRAIRPYIPTPATTARLAGNTEPEPTYPTPMGALTFEQLYQQTARITGFVMRERLGMTNPEDIDDCMQAGYLNVWRLLQKQPDLFADKPKKYIVQAVVFRSKAQRYSHLRHYLKIVYDAPAADLGDTNSPTTHQIDTWMDLQQAVTIVGEHVATDEPLIYLLALYALITAVKTQDVVRLFGCGTSTITRVKKQVRSTLARELPGYGQSDDTSDALVIPEDRLPRHPQTARNGVAMLFF